VPAQDELDLDAVRSCELSQVQDMDDAAVVLQALCDVVEDMHLGVFDRIDVCRGGVLLVTVLNASRDCGRSVSVDVFSLRWRLQTALAKGDGGGYSVGSVVGCALVGCVLVGCAAILLQL
jgi:hypothetical protein